MKNIVVQIISPGGPEQLRVSEQAALQPSDGEIVVRHEAIGMNFLDIYHRKGIYPLPSYPATPGAEAAGRIEAVGPGVDRLNVGDRIAYGGAPVGSYATTRLLSAARAIPLPDDIDSKVAAASLLKGMTAYMLLHQTYPVTKDSTILVHAAAGGLGAILVKWAKHLGATVIGTAGSPEKAELARSYGADHLIVGRNADVVAKVKAFTGGRGVDVGYDGIGSSMLSKTIQCVRPFGTAATIGQAAGPVPPVSVEELRPGKSLSHPSIMAYTADAQNYREAAEATIAMMRQGIAATIAGEYPLDRAADAQADLESGRFSGSLLLIP